MHPPAKRPSPPWDVFCRVIDNYGDIGVCWRLAADLASRGVQVRLWIDDARPLAWMAPGGKPGVEVLPWSNAMAAESSGDVVIEAFGCNPPDEFVQRMAAAATPPLWINVEYLSAEPEVARLHGMPSPQTMGPGAGLMKWFYYPGFDTHTGGLIREQALIPQIRAFDRTIWLAAQGILPMAGERLVSVFCYPAAPLASLPRWIGAQPTLLLLAPGVAVPPLPAGWRAQQLPWLPQPDYDRLLWACDLNLVRGEDSFVRAQWAGVPFLWQIYPQDDRAHIAKLDAFVDRFAAGAPCALSAHIRALHQGWNGLEAAPTEAHDPAGAVALWSDWCVNWRDRLLCQPDFTTGLMDWVAQKR